MTTPIPRPTATVIVTAWALQNPCLPQRREADFATTFAG